VFICLKGLCCFPPVPDYRVSNHQRTGVHLTIHQAEKIK
jgi:hypothetical protein